MTTAANIRKWASEGESETQEFKTTTGQRREAAQTLCAMLNGRGGRIVFGIDPQGQVRGLEVSDRTLEEVAQEIRAIDPPVTPLTEVINLKDGKKVIVLTTSNGPNPPYACRDTSYKRVANTTSKMTREEYNRILLERVHSNQRWERQPLRDWTIDDLDKTEIVRTVDEAIRKGRLEDPETRDPFQILRSLDLIKDEQLVRAAAVLFGREERLQADFPQCLLRLAKFKGLDKSEFIDNKQVHGNLFRLMSRATGFLLDHLPIAGRIIPGVIERQDDPLFPPEALREALANAFCHRDYGMGGGSVSVGLYDDRLEVTSAGLLHFGLTPQDLYGPHESKPWNLSIAKVLYRRGVIEHWGRGTLKIKELMTNAGLATPTIEEIAGSVVMTFRKPSRPRAGSSSKIDRLNQAVLSAIQESGGGLGLTELQARFGKRWTARQIRHSLQLLKKRNLVTSAGRGSSSTWNLK